MGAELGWIDFSTEHRERVMSVIDLLGDAGAVDELGIGTTRDAIANRLFPGISTIQTRPKYFVLIPQIFREYQRMAKHTRRMPALKDFLLKKEKELINLLAKNHNYQSRQGIIGITKAGTSAGLARYPSSIYWNGIRTHGLIETKESLAEYLRRCDLSGEHESKAEGDDEIYEDTFGIRLSNLPSYNDDVRLELTQEEANMLRNYFQDRYRGIKAEDNLLSLIVSSDSRMEMVAASPSFNPMAEQLISDTELPESIREVIQMALQFDFLMYGAQVRYNLMLHNKFGDNQESDLEERWTNWLNEISSNPEEMASFNLEKLFSQVASNVDERTANFIRNWKRLILEEHSNIDEMEQLIKHQEIRIKKGRAKLVAKDLVYQDWIGIEKLEYRFIQVKSLVTDLMNPYATS